MSKEFYGLMATAGLSGVKAVVDDKAASTGKSVIVNEFMKKVSLHGKGGGTTLPRQGELEHWTLDRARTHQKNGGFAPHDLLS
ncbi:MAG TPA: hypothetical protein VEV85_17085 [Bryobacteraceae bacterium]|nr:hypothetical protein [Bryobacteraceae bacterium]